MADKPKAPRILTGIALLAALIPLCLLSGQLGIAPIDFVGAALLVGIPALLIIVGPPVAGGTG